MPVFGALCVFSACDLCVAMLHHWSVYFTFVLPRRTISLRVLRMLPLCCHVAPLVCLLLCVLRMQPLYCPVAPLVFAVMLAAVTLISTRHLPSQIRGGGVQLLLLVFVTVSSLAALRLLFVLRREGVFDLAWPLQPQLAPFAWADRTTVSRIATLPESGMVQDLPFWRGKDATSLLVTHPMSSSVSTGKHQEDVDRSLTRIAIVAQDVEYTKAGQL